MWGAVQKKRVFIIRLTYLHAKVFETIITWEQRLCLSTMATNNPSTLSKISAKNPPRISHLSQQQLKRQREWVYLAHFLALLQLHPRKTISGSDDGREPDFTCVFDVDNRSQDSELGYQIGIELTTLPRLRDRLGNENLLLKRWYWQSLLQVSTRFTPVTLSHRPSAAVPNTNAQQFGAMDNPMVWQHFQSHNVITLPIAQNAQDQENGRKRNGLSSKLWYLTHQLPKRVAKRMNMPSAFLADTNDGFTQLPIDSVIVQADIDAVMLKKAHKVAAYHQRRRLDEVWLLIHTNEQQENGVLEIDLNTELTHHSDFDRVFLTRYPNASVVQLPR